MPAPDGPQAMRQRLQWARSITARYGGPASQATGEPVFAQLPELAEALDWACQEGTQQDVRDALPVADVLGAAWERLGEHAQGRARLDAALAAATRVGVTQDLVIARVLRRRARLAMSSGIDHEADEDLLRAHAIADAHDDRLIVSIVLDRADLAMHRGGWDAAAGIVPELLRRTGASGDPLLQAMGLNRAGWAAFGTRDVGLAALRYEAAWGLASLHEDPMVEARTASGLAITGMLAGDMERGRTGWRRALELAESLHDRGFTLHCLDGIAALLALSHREQEGLSLSTSVSGLRALLGVPREQAMLDLHRLVAGRAPDLAAPGESWPYGQALTRARQAVT